MSVSGIRRRGLGARKTIAEVHEEPAGLPIGTAWPGWGAAGRRVVVRWITSCVEERGRGEGTEVCGRARGELAELNAIPV